MFYVNCNFEVTIMELWDTYDKNGNKLNFDLIKGETIAYKWVSKEEFIAYMDSDDCMDTQKTD